jgi:5,5'-dehydrodivanillate O-demethylase
MISIATRPDGSRLEAHGFMPNILFRQVPIQQDHTKMSIHLAWRVPIDDTTTLSVMVNRVGAYDADTRAAYRGRCASRYAAAAPQATTRSNR